tara:strand:+ start:201103 stop:201540 length:438 start_codon:yes stop_codon:yes gene_type:complete
LLSRKEQERLGIVLPEQWRQKVESVLYGVYQKNCDNDKKGFQVYAITYPDELLLTASYLNQEKLEEAPVTYMISMDLEEKEDPQKYLDTLIDSIGIFFDQYFADANWNDYQANWEEAEYKKLKFFYKISRENMALSIQAEQLLNQ